MIYVLDASVIIKWFVVEEDSDKAEKILEQYKAATIDIIVPDIMIYEVANALRFNPFFNRKEKQNCINRLYSLDMFMTSPTEFSLIQSIKVAEEKDLTVYDTTYIVLAEHVGCGYITADEKCYKKVKDDYNFVRLLKNIT